MSLRFTTTVADLDMKHSLLHSLEWSIVISQASSTGRDEAPQIAAWGSRQSIIPSSIVHVKSVHLTVQGSIAKPVIYAQSQYACDEQQQQLLVISDAHKTHPVLPIGCFVPGDQVNASEVYWT